MSHDLEDTIAAVASPPGGAARGIVRLSGPGVLECLGRAFAAADGRPLASVRRPTVVEGHLRLARLAAPLPCELYLWPTHRSYTGQPVAELHTLGSPPLVEAALAACLAAGAREARPGEFTLRAYLSGRIDLAQAEAVLGVIDAANTAQLEAALAQLAGGLAQPLGHLRQMLLDLLCDLEAGFDFADEDLPFLSPERLCEQLAAASESAAALTEQLGCRHRIGPAVRAILVGWTNAGKSSLFNALTGEPGALVGARPGTTRDYLTADLDLGGVRCVLIDTAGAERTPNGNKVDVRAASRRAAQRQREEAEIEVLCLDGSRPTNAWERSQLRRPAPAKRILVQTKADLAEPGPSESAVIRASSKTGEGLDRLREELRQAVAECGAGGGAVAATCGEALRGTAEALARASQTAQRERAEELVAADVRLALDHLGEVSGAVYTEDILDRLFSRFCVGK